MDGLEYNTDNLYDLASNISSTLKEFEGYIDSMYSTIDGTMNSEDYWQGAAYDSFKAYCDNYKSQSIDPLLTTIGNWATSVNSIAEASQENTDSNTALFN